MARGRMLVAALCGLMVTVSCAGAAHSRKGPSSFPLPASKKDCATCHQMEGSKPALALRKSMPDLCLECHTDRVAPAEHRIDIAPPAISKDLPLINGKLSCITCHDPHKNTYGALLRMKRTELCLTCHPV